MLFDHENKAFLSGDFELDLATVRVVQDAAENPIEFVGKGLLRHKGPLELELRVYVDEAQGLPPVEHRSLDAVVRPEGSVKSGEVFPDHHYYSFEATDLTSRMWAGRRFVLHQNVGPGDSRVLTASIERISTVQKEPENVTFASSVIILIIPGTGYLPSFSRFKQVAAAGCKFEVEQCEDYLKLSAESEQPLPDYFETRVIEALNFAFGRTLYWTMLTKQAGDQTETTLRRDRTNQQSQIDRPIQELHDFKQDATFDIFGRYLTFVLPFIPTEVPPFAGDQMHDVSAWLHYVRSVAATSAYSKGLAAGVAVEGILPVCCPSVPTISAEQKGYIEDLKNYVSKWAGDPEPVRRDNTIKRILGGMARWGEVSAKDRLRQLRDAGVITQAHLKAWDEVRNAAAHGRPPKRSEMQEWVNNYYSVEVMLFRMIFHLIRYTGPYTNYSAPTWPVEKFGTPLCGSEATG